MEGKPKSRIPVLLSKQMLSTTSANRKVKRETTSDVYSSLWALGRDEPVHESYTPSCTDDSESPKDPNMYTLAQLTEMLAQGLQTSHYRKLKMYSGIEPVPLGEEKFDVWKEHALQCLDEWTCSDDTKRQRIIESLRSPASEIIRMHKALHRDATAADYIHVLTAYYGSYYDLEQMIVDYRMLKQKEGESISHFIHRLQLSLSRLLFHKAIETDDIDDLRTNQLLRGLLPHHPLTSTLKPMLRAGDLPVFELLSTVKKLEAELQFNLPRGTPKGASASPPKGERVEPSRLRVEVGKVSVSSGQRASVRKRPVPNRSLVSSRSNSERCPAERCPNCKDVGHSFTQCPEPLEGTVHKVTCSTSSRKRRPFKRRTGVSTDGVDHRSHYQYVTRLKDTLKSAYVWAEENAARENAHNKKRYDLRIRSQELNVGDSVLLRNLGVREKHKLADRWRKEVFTVVDKLPSLPVYKIQSPEGRVKAWHRNRLMPLPQTNSEDSVSDSPVPSPPTSGPDVPHSSSRNKELPSISTDYANTHESDWSVVPEVSNTESQPLFDGMTLKSTDSIPDAVALPPRVVRRGDRVRYPPHLLTYDSFGNPTYYTQSQVHQAGVGLISVFVPVISNYMSCKYCY